jgi:TonB family protein
MIARGQQNQESSDKKQQSAKNSGDDKSGSAAKQNSTDPVYDPGKDVKAPKLIHYVEPEFSPSSKEAFVEGTVKISTVVTRDGVPTELKVLRGLNAKEDETAIDALRQWRFQPGTKEGQPVKVRVTVEVDFHLL